MQSPVQLEPGVGRVRVGEQSYPCTVTARGLVVFGLPVRSLTLEERAIAVALAGRRLGRESRLSTLVADMATEPGAWAAGLGEIEQVTIEAIALHLAGAGGAGSLTTTMVLVCRALGWRTDEPLNMTALSADDLAAGVLARIDVGEGWTTIVLDESGTDMSAWTAREARDHLARRLAERADEPSAVARTMAESLDELTPGGGSRLASAARGQDVRSTAARPPVPDRWTSAVSGATPSFPRGEQDAVLFALTAATTSAWEQAAPADQAAALTPGRSKTPTAIATTSSLAGLVSRPRVLTESDWSTSPERRSSPRTTRGTTASGSPFLDGSPWWPEPAEVRPPRPSAAPEPAATARRGSTLPTTASRPAVASYDALVIGSPRPASGDVGLSLDAIGLALDVAADLRGVSR